MQHFVEIVTGDLSDKHIELNCESTKPGIVHIDEMWTTITGDIHLFSGVHNEQCINFDNPKHLYCCMVGIPKEIVQKDFMIFIEPYVSCIEHIFVLSDLKENNNKVAVLRFTDNMSQLAFAKLYDSLHFPSYCGAPPCITMPLMHFQIVDKAVSSKTEDHDPCKSDVGEAPRVRPPYFIDALAEQAQMEAGTASSAEPRAHATTDDNKVSSHMNEITSAGEEAEVVTNTRGPVQLHQLCMCSTAHDQFPLWRRLPICPLCLRRLQPSTSGLASADAGSAADGLLYKTLNQINSCIVCEVFLNEEHERRKCEQCGLRGNLWVCLVCGYTGCGRYTSQHAKGHFHDTEFGTTHTIPSYTRIPTCCRCSKHNWSSLLYTRL